MHIFPGYLLFRELRKDKGEPKERVKDSECDRQDMARFGIEHEG